MFAMQAWRTRSRAALARATTLVGAIALAGCLDAGIIEIPDAGADDDDDAVAVVALAGPDLVVVEGSTVALSGEASRGLTGAPLLSWAQVSGPPVLLANP